MREVMNEQLPGRNTKCKGRKCHFLPFYYYNLCGSVYFFQQDFTLQAEKGEIREAEESFRWHGRKKLKQVVV